MNEGDSVRVFVNPLVFFQADDAMPKELKGSLDERSVLDYLCSPSVSTSLSDFASRYGELSVEARRLFAAPTDSRLLAKLVWPLRYALGNFMVGSYLGTIALCGYVAEMIATMLFEMSDFKLGGKVLDKNGQELLLGQDFENLRQERRTGVLYALGLIDENLKGRFDLVRRRRNKYLHIYSKDVEGLPADAKEVFRSTIEIVVRIIGQEVEDGKLKLSPEVLRYLNKG